MWEDVRFAVRLLRRSPGFTVAALLTLALGVGVNTAVFSVVNAVVLRPLPVRDAERLIVVATESDSGVPLGGLSWRDLQDHRTASDVFEDLAGYNVGFSGLTVEGSRASRVLSTSVTGNYFRLLDIRPAVGRFIDAEDGAGRIDPVVVLGHSAWIRRFGGDPSAVGRSVRVNGRLCTVIGVAPRGFFGVFAFSDPEIYLPINWSGHADFESRSARSLHVIGRLRGGVDIRRAQAAASATAERIAREFPDTNRGVGVRILPERFARPEEDNARSTAFVSTVMVGLVGLVLAIATINVANLLLARAARRRRELAIRAAIGAGRTRLVRQMMTESLTLALLGGGAGLLFGMWMGTALASLRVPGDLPVRFDFHFDGRVFAYGSGVVLATGIFAGLAPALRASRGDIDRMLRESRHGARFVIGRLRVGNALVVTQVAACFVVLTAAGLLLRSLIAGERVDLGFRPESVLNLHMDVGQLGYTETHGRAFFSALERRVRALPGIEQAAFACTVPLGYITFTQAIEADGYAAAAARHSSGFNLVSASYFTTMGIPIVRGRAFSEQDDERSRPVAIVNQRLADMLWPGRDPIGRRFRRPGQPGTSIEVVGVVPTGKYRLLVEDPQPHFYLPLSQQYVGLQVLQVRTAVTPAALAPAIERIIQQLEPDLPVYDVMTMEKALGGGRGFLLMRIGAASAILFALLGLALASVGIYGVVSYMAEQRTHEIGVRMALGATRHAVLTLVLRQELLVCAAGIVIGVAGALALSSMLQTLLFGVPTRDPVTLGVVMSLLLVVTAVAGYLPARRATAIDPVTAMRGE